MARAIDVVQKDNGEKDRASREAAKNVEEEKYIRALTSTAGKADAITFVRSVTVSLILFASSAKAVNVTPSSAVAANGAVPREKPAAEAHVWVTHLRSRSGCTGCQLTMSRRKRTFPLARGVSKRPLSMTSRA